VVQTFDAHWPGFTQGWPLSRTHTLLAQVAFVPHAFPQVLQLLLSLVVFTHVPEQSVSPLGQPHVPPAHTMPDPEAPQAVPFAAFPADVHVETPPAHEVVPVWHTLPPGLQGRPAVHGPHWPSSQ
jgi:hypothetical protein